MNTFVFLQCGFFAAMAFGCLDLFFHSKRDGEATATDICHLSCLVVGYSYKMLLPYTWVLTSLASPAHPNWCSVVYGL